METEGIKLLNKAIVLLQQSGIKVRMTHMYGCEGIDWIIGLPPEIFRNGDNRFEMRDNDEVLREGSVR